MPERHVVVGSKVGLHARPAALFAQAAARQPVKVTLAKPGDDPVDARSVLMVLGLDVRGGEEVILAAEGDGAERALDELAALVASDLDAPAPVRQLQGVGVSAGVAIGPVARMGGAVPEPADGPGGDPAAEAAAVAEALE